MNGKLNDRDAKCPFFSYHMRESITCESLIPREGLPLVRYDEPP